jgi:hypothetical protein
MLLKLLSVHNVFSIFSPCSTSRLYLNASTVLGLKERLQIRNKKDEIVGASVKKFQ